MCIEKELCWNLGELEELREHLQCTGPLTITLQFLPSMESADSRRGNLVDTETNPCRILEQIELLYVRILSPRKSSPCSTVSPPQPPLTVPV